MKNKLILLTSMVFSINVIAQHLPNVQTQNYLVNGIKVDGKTEDWGPAFKAYNTSTLVYYSVGHDNKNLYLIIQAKDKNVIGKILGGAVTLTLKNEDHKESTSFSITYPIITGDKSILINPITDTSKLSLPVFNDLNSELASKTTDIKIENSKNSDSLISVYNDLGVKAANRFTIDKTYTYELAVPLNLIKLSLDNPIALIYNVKLNGIPITIKNNKPLTDKQSENLNSLLGQLQAKTGNGLMEKSTPTDFNGKYSFQK